MGCRVDSTYKPVAVDIGVKSVLRPIERGRSERKSLRLYMRSSSSKGVVMVVDVMQRVEVEHSVGRREGETAKN